jgi:hypothetical protein
MKENGSPRSIEAINRPVELLRTVLNYAVEEKASRGPEPFSEEEGKIIDR